MQGFYLASPPHDFSTEKFADGINQNRQGNERTERVEKNLIPFLSTHGIKTEECGYLSEDRNDRPGTDIPHRA